MKKPDRILRQVSCIRESRYHSNPEKNRSTGVVKGLGCSSITIKKTAVECQTHIAIDALINDTALRLLLLHTLTTHPSLSPAVKFSTVQLEHILILIIIINAN